jgi:hypothetical protein
MTVNVDNPKVLIDSKASRLAFQAGQTLERLLLARAVVLASENGVQVATVDHVGESLDEELLQELAESVRANQHGEKQSAHRRSA